MTIEGNDHTITLINPDGGDFNNFNSSGKLTLSNATLAPSNKVGTLMIGDYADTADFHNVVFEVFVYIYGVNSATFENCTFDGMQVQSAKDVTATITESTIKELTLNPQVNDHTLVVSEDLTLIDTKVDTLLLLHNIIVKDNLDVGSVSNYPEITDVVLTIDGGTLSYDKIDDSDMKVVINSGSIIDKTAKSSSSTIDAEGKSEAEIDGNMVAIDSNATEGTVEIAINEVSPGPAVSDALNVFDITITVTDASGNPTGYSATVTLKIDNAGKNPVVVKSYDNSWRFIEEHTVTSYSSNSVTFITTHNTYFVVETYEAPTGVEDEEEYPFFPWGGNNQGSVVTPVEEDSSDDNTKVIAAAAAIVVIMLAAVAMMVNRNN